MEKVRRSEVLGLDGNYVDEDALLIARSELVVSNLANPVDMGKKFDLVESLEVAEHLPNRSEHLH